MLTYNPKRKFASWGDAELDRLWLELYELEKGLDDMDLATDSPKLQKWESVSKIFRARMAVVSGDKF